MSPGSGVLLLSAEGGLSLNQDNIVSYHPDGDGWLIHSRDLPASPPPLQTPGNEPVAAFVFIPAAVRAALISPTNDAWNAGTSPSLRAAVSNAASANLTIQFYGRVAPPARADFALVALPDTQYYAASLNGGLPAMWAAQTEWIITNRIPRNIPYVAHLGDIVDRGDLIGSSANLTEWRNATNAMYRLESPARTLLGEGIAYGMAVGNHDQEPNGDPAGTTLYFNQYFGVSHFAGRSYYGGHYGINNNNHFDFFSAGGMDFIVLYFEYDTNANPAVLAWGSEVLRTNASRRAIVVTHYAGNAATPCSFSAQSAAIYNTLKTNANFFLMLGGHVNGEGSRVDTFNGHAVHTLISDYQFRTNGGNGFMRVMDFSPSNNLVKVTTFSPWTGQYEADADSQFSFTYDMRMPPGTNPAPFELIGTVTNVAPGSVASLVWSDRRVNTAYEWYVTVTDGSDTATSSTWRFTTAPNIGPVASNSLVTVLGDAPTNLILAASDANGDPLTFETNSVPQHGLNLNFDSNTGAFTYQPAHGFRGLDRFTWRASDGFLTSSMVTFNLNVIAPPDENANGLPDAWESAYGVRDPYADDDGDGLTNLEEYFANTNPTNAASALRIISASRATDGQVTLVWSSVGGTRYRVQFSDGGTDGSPSGGFLDVVRPVNLEIDASPYGAAATQSFVDDFTRTGGVPTDQARYYRIKVVQ